MNFDEDDSPTLPVKVGMSEVKSNGRYWQSYAHLCGEALQREDGNVITHKRITTPTVDFFPSKAPEAMMSRAI